MTMSDLEKRMLLLWLVTLIGYCMLPNKTTQAAMLMTAAISTLTILYNIIKNRRKNK